MRKMYHLSPRCHRELGLRRLPVGGGPRSPRRHFPFGQVASPAKKTERSENVVLRENFKLSQRGKYLYSQFDHTVKQLLGAVKQVPLKESRRAGSDAPALTACRVGGRFRACRDGGTCGGEEQELGTGAVRSRYKRQTRWYAARTALPVRLAREHGRGIAADRGRARGLVCWPRLLRRRAGDRRRPRHPAELTQGSAVRVRRSEVHLARAPGGGEMASSC